MSSRASVKVEIGDHTIAPQITAIINRFVKEKIGNAEHNQYQVGVFSEEERKGTPVVDYAYYNEYGTVHTPARSFMRSTAKEQKESWFRKIKRDFPKNNLDTALQKLAQRMVKDIKEKIESNVPPPNAPGTIRQKGHGNTLIESELLLNSIEYKKVNRGDE